ncbi:PREDICTED: zinc finger CCCH domain-containing protein 44-like [Camelina sativa]|uniref:Zinc finger CCCH domain-containing protein 44-like n=1 Tax=Camelina sativa TaxID=90675 RepID=A0ABM1RD60_CAMSA|nr:PREDICTED: zinc finger CCCH domain-containing protein 44-like [Camelina sativa]
MPEIDLMRVDHCVSDLNLDAKPPGFFDSGGSVDLDVKLEDDEDEVQEEEEDSDCLKKKKKSVGRSTKRGRPPRTLGCKASSSPVSRKRREDEDVCFVCFDGGSLVLCDRRGCPKAYHPACVKRTEAFFRSRAKWNCGWHICTACQKDSFYMCYTCPYSVCKRCVRSSEYVVVRENKGFCGICMKTILLIENAADPTKEKVQVDFDDQGSWEYLFKIYWVSLKEKLSLTLDDLSNARNPWKSSSSTVSKRRTTSRVHEKGNGNSPEVMKVSRAKVRKMETASVIKLGPSLDNRLPPLTSATAWATDELLDFVRYMKNGDASVLSKYDVQTLVLEHVRRNNLQSSPQNSDIMCDAKLMRLFGKERVDHFEMLKLLDSHFRHQERSPVTDTSAGAVTETMSFRVDASRSCDRLNASAQYQDRLNGSVHHQEGESQQLNVHNSQVRPSSSNSRNHAVVKPETCATVSNKPIDGLDTNMVWLYGDPDGKIHGPFSLLNLRQWNSSGHFPPELRIWRLGEQQNSSILLTDALNGQFHKTGFLQNHSIPKKEVTAPIANDQHRSVAVPKLESRILDFSPNSVCTDQSVISSSNSVITRSSDVSNKSGNNFSLNVPLDFSLSNERDNVGSASLWNKRKVESPLLVQSPISCSLSLSTLPGNSNCSMPPHERWNAGQTDLDGNNAAMNACNQNGSLSGSGEKQHVTATVQSCGQNWNAATPSSASNVWDSNSGLASFPDNQEIDFLDLFSPSFKFNFASTSTDWQPIVAGPDECDESVSDLLAEVEAMESQKRLPSPTSTFRGPEELLIRHSVNDSFSPAEGHSPALDVSKGDSMSSSTNDLQMHSRSNSVVHF